MARKRPWQLAEISLKDARQTRYDVAVLPCGCVEPHGLHLPYGTDTLEAAEVCDRACAWAWEQGAKVLLLPALPYGAVQNMMGFPLAINLDQELLDAIVASVARSLEHHGILKLVVVNGHGGNDFKGGIRALYGRSPVFVCLINWYQMMGDEIKSICERPSDHAEEMETSLTQAIAPELVDLASADPGVTKQSRFEAGRRGWVWYPRPFERLNPTCTSGDPRPASAAKGRRLLDAVGPKMGRFLVELAQAQRDADFPFEAGK
jgi:creatinine amidohydrolase